MLSTRRRQLNACLGRVGIGARFIALQSNLPGALLPPLRPPLLVDTTTLAPLTTAAILVEISARRSPLAALALVHAGDRVTQTLLAVCPAVYAVVAERDDLDALVPLIRLGAPWAYPRAPSGPYWVGIAPPHAPIVSTDLPMLVALAYARSMAEAAERCGVHERTLYRRLAVLRTTLSLPPTATTRFQPADLARAIVTALAHDPAQ